MEVKPGYKQTEVGVVPKEWEVAPLSREIDGLDAGVSVNSVDEELGSYAHAQAVLKTSAIAGGRFLPHENKKIAPRDVGRAKLNPRKDTIIISRMNTPDLVGECGYVFAEFPSLFLPDRLWMTRSRDGSDICVSWLNYLLSSKPYKTRIKGLATGTSGSMKNIAKDVLLSMLIPYPDGAEQRAIAGALNDVDALIGALTQLIAKKRDLKQAVMQQLLTGKTRLPGFHGEWDVKRLGEISRLYQPVTISANLFTESGYPVYGANGVVGFYHDFNHDTWQITITCRGSTYGTVNRTMEKCWITGNAMVVNCEQSKDLNKDFLYYLLLSQDLSVCITGTGQPQIVRGPLANVELRIPRELAEQSAIAEVLLDMDADLAALERRLAKTRALKQGMMQELLTGRTRLK